MAAPPTPVPVAYAPPPAPTPVASLSTDPMARVRAIQNHPEASGREDMAKYLALETATSVEAAGGILSRSARGPSPIVASAAAGARVAREALGLPADPAADAALAAGVASTLGAPAGADAAASARWSADFDEGARTARELLGR